MVFCVCIEGEREEEMRGRDERRGGMEREGEG